MIEPLDMLRSQWKTAHIKGKNDENVAISRSEKSNSQINYNFTVKLVVKRKTQIELGDFVTIDNEDYFVIGKINTQVKLRRVNCTIDIVRITPHYTGTKKDYDFEEPLHSSITAFYEDVTGKQQMYDAGLLSTSTRRFLLPNISIKLLDRIKFNNDPMQVDSINNSSFPGLLWVQCRPDVRPIK